MSIGALVIPVDMDVYSLGSSPVLASSPRLGADFLSTSPLLGADFLSELHRPSWREPRALFGRIGCRRHSPPPQSDDDDDDEEEEDEVEDDEEDDVVADGRLRSILVARGRRLRADARHKKVVFADDRGMPLVQVRWMREPSHIPPRWTARFYRHVTGVETAPAPQRPVWTLGFPQPAADYTRFCERLDVASVALEHALYKQLGGTVAGTIKVKNLHFEKEVFVRVTGDDWRSSRDVPAAYAPPATTGVTVYDRFAFSFPLPDVKGRVQFCVCFRCPAGEFWDNNGGRNFTVTLQRAAPAHSGAADVYHADVDNWSCFSSWGDEFGGGPYW